MKPQNKVTIFMLVMIVMLSIYYFAMPGKDKPIDDGDDPIFSQEFIDLRKVKTDARQAMIEDLYDYIGTDVNPDQVNAALSTISEITTLTTNESLFEAELIDVGYYDAYVEGSNREVKVFLYTDELSTTQVINIVDKAKMRFGTDVNVITRYGYEVN
ncbi:MAG: SpoIIIAH-like protein [Haloplasmataceae bacterium]|jgi:hypothetical protein|nr:SpoIIIAH-like protein [Haloplasmataceae bacterium]